MIDPSVRMSFSQGPRIRQNLKKKNRNGNNKNKINKQKQTKTTKHTHKTYMRFISAASYFHVEQFENFMSRCTDFENKQINAELNSSIVFLNSFNKRCGITDSFSVLILILLNNRFLLQSYCLHHVYQRGFQFWLNIVFWFPCVYR